jgi:hypothetical protein
MADQEQNLLASVNNSLLTRTSVAAAPAGSQQLQNSLTTALHNILSGQALTAGQQAQLAAATSAAAADGAAAGAGEAHVALFAAAALMWTRMLVGAFNTPWYQFRFHPRPPARPHQDRATSEICCCTIQT